MVVYFFFLNLLSLTISKIVHHGIQSNFQEDDAIEGFQSSQSKETWLSHVHRDNGKEHERRTFPNSAWILHAGRCLSCNWNLCNAGSSLLRQVRYRSWNRLVDMTREELKERVSKLIQTLENVERSLQFTNIPVHVLTNYIKEETNIDITKN